MGEQQAKGDGRREEGGNEAPILKSSPFDKERSDVCFNMIEAQKWRIFV
jgi:hypothetical protein